CTREQPSLTTSPSLELTVTILHASLYTTLFRSPFISPADGLHPRDVPVPPVVRVGAVRSKIQFIVLDAVEVLPQASLAVHVLVCVREQPLLSTVPSLADIVGVL